MNLIKHMLGAPWSMERQGLYSRFDIFRMIGHLLKRHRKTWGEVEAEIPQRSTDYDSCASSIFWVLGIAVMFSISAEPEDVAM